jgi:hypothetical protein
MEWLAQDWVWIVIFGLFIGMHLFGHGGHGGRGGHGGHGGLQQLQLLEMQILE